MTAVLETYITHIRITEFSSHPSSPPPPQARTPDSQKPRVIIVAVRKSGRVRLHKSKENPNGTFSIGKTWNLDDLTHIESFTGPQVSPTNREWAGDTGFLVSLGKPYYWQSQTDKEKKFFIASLIKIYGKYTGGKSPELTGFDQKEQDQVLGAGRRPAAGSSAPSPIPPGPPRPPLPEAAPSHQSSTSAASASAVPEAPRIQKVPPGRTPLNGSSPAGSFDSTTSRDRLPLRRVAQNNKSQDSVATSFANRSDDAASLPPRSRNGMAGPGAFGRFGEPRETSEPPTEPLPPTPKTQSQDKIVPDRRRPPMDPSRPLDRDLVPPPLNSPVGKKDPVAPPPRSVDRMSPRKNSLGQQSSPQSLSLSPRDTPPPAMAPIESTKSEPVKPDPSIGLKSPSSTSLANTAASPPGPAAETPPPPPVPADADDEARPGLGPMIKSKKSKGDIAGAFWKAASAATAFKPRPGGAGERLRQLAEKAAAAEGPDGITGVVPAPPRPASRGKDSKEPEETKELAAPPPPPEPARSPKRNSRNSNVPEVKITVPNSSRPSSVQGPVKEVPKPEEPTPKPRRSVLAGNDAKFLQSLGINPTMLDGRSEEFGNWLDYFGWVPGEQMRTRNIDDLKTDLDRELNKAQAGGWLARFQEEDERVGAIKRGIDVSISECEELDNLLTLYSVELSVSDCIILLQRHTNILPDTLRRHCIYRSPGSGSSGPNRQPEASQD